MECIYNKDMNTGKKNIRSGQVVLITLLVLSIATTVALSFIARSNIDVNMTNQMEESAKAFSAAEAGIEDTLKNNGSASNGVKVLSDTGTAYQTTVTDIGAATGVFSFPQKTSDGGVETLWLVNHATDGTDTLTETPTYTQTTMDVCWTHETVTPAVSINLFYKRSGVYYVARGMFDPDATRRTSNNFGSITDASAGCGKTNVYKRTITFATDFGVNPATDTMLFMRLRPIYGQTNFSVDTAGATLPLQGKVIESTGSTLTDETKTKQMGVTRKIQVYQFYRAPSIMFDAVLYSQGDLVK